MNADTSAASQVEVVDYEELGDSQQKHYETLVIDAARILRSGLFTLVEIEPMAVVPDNAEPPQALTDRFCNHVGNEPKVL